MGIYENTDFRNSPHPWKNSAPFNFSFALGLYTANGTIVRWIFSEALDSLARQSRIFTQCGGMRPSAIKYQRLRIRSTRGTTPTKLSCEVRSMDIGDVTKFKFEFDNVRTLQVFNRFEIRRMFYALCRQKPCSTTDFVCTESQRAQTNLFFLKFNLSHKLQLLTLQHNFAQWCVTLY